MTKLAKGFIWRLVILNSQKDGKGVEEPFFFLANEWYKLYLEKADGFKTYMVNWHPNSYQTMANNPVNERTFWREPTYICEIKILKLFADVQWNK